MHEIAFVATTFFSDFTAEDPRGGSVTSQLKHEVQSGEGWGGATKQNILLPTVLGRPDRSLTGKLGESSRALDWP